MCMFASPAAVVCFVRCAKIHLSWLNLKVNPTVLVCLTSHFKISNQSHTHINSWTHIFNYGTLVHCSAQVWPDYSLSVRACVKDRQRERESRSFLSCKAWEKWNLNASHWLSNSSCLYWCTGLLPTRGLFHFKGSAFTHTQTHTYTFVLTCEHEMHSNLYLYFRPISVMSTSMCNLRYKKGHSKCDSMCNSNLYLSSESL